MHTFYRLIFISHIILSLGIANGAEEVTLNIDGHPQQKLEKKTFKNCVFDPNTGRFDGEFFTYADETAQKLAIYFPNLEQKQICNELQIQKDKLSLLRKQFDNNQVGEFEELKEYKKRDDRNSKEDSTYIPQFNTTYLERYSELETALSPLHRQEEIVQDLYFKSILTIPEWLQHLFYFTMSSPRSLRFEATEFGAEIINSKSFLESIIPYGDPKISLVRLIYSTEAIHTFLLEHAADCLKYIREKSNPSGLGEIKPELVDETAKENLERKSDELKNIYEFYNRLIGELKTFKEESEDAIRITEEKLKKAKQESSHTSLYGERCVIS